MAHLLIEIFFVRRIIKLSSPNLNNVIIIGCVLTLMTVFFEDTGNGHVLLFCKVIMATSYCIYLYIPSPGTKFLCSNLLRNGMEWGTWSTQIYTGTLSYNSMINVYKMQRNYFCYCCNITYFIFTSIAQKEIKKVFN